MDNFASTPNFANYPPVTTTTTTATNNTNNNTQSTTYEQSILNSQEYLISSTDTSITSTPLSDSTSPYSSANKQNNLQQQMTTLPYESLNSTFNTTVPYSSGFSNFYEDPLTQSYETLSYATNEPSLNIDPNQTSVYLNKENRTNQVDLSQSQSLYKSNPTTTNAYYQRVSANSTSTAMTPTNGQTSESNSPLNNTSYYLNQSDQYYQNSRQYYSNQYQANSWPSYNNTNNTNTNTNTNNNNSDTTQSYYSNSQTYSNSNKQTYYSQFNYNQQNTFFSNTWTDSGIYPVNGSNSSSPLNNSFTQKSQAYQANTPMLKTNDNFDNAQNFLQATNLANHSVSDGYFNNNYFKMTNKAKNKKMPHTNNNSNNYKIKQSWPVKRKASEDVKKEMSCNVCGSELEMGNESNCGDCIGFFRRYTKKSKRPAQCGHLEPVLDCISCKYERCLSLGLNLTLKYPTQIETDLNDLTLSSSNSLTPSQLNEHSLQYTNNEHLISQILIEFNSKKNLIWSASNEQTVKELILQLAKNITQFMGFLKQNFTSAEISRHLIIAFVSLFDNCANNKNNYLNFLVTNDFKQQDQRIKNQLIKIYSHLNHQSKKNIKKETNDFENINCNIDNNNNVYNEEMLTSNNNNNNINNLQFNYNQSYFAYNQNYNYTNYNQSFNGDNYNFSSLPSLNEQEISYSKPQQQFNLNQLKSLHFLLILFTSISNLDISSAPSTSSQSTDLNDAPENFFACQKLILSMIEKTCEDRLVKDKIVLSVTELVDFF